MMSGSHFAYNSNNYKRISEGRGIWSGIIVSNVSFSNINKPNEACNEIGCTETDRDEYLRKKKKKTSNNNSTHTYKLSFPHAHSLIQSLKQNMNTARKIKHSWLGVVCMYVWRHSVAVYTMWNDICDIKLRLHSFHIQANKWSSVIWSLVRLL